MDIEPRTREDLAALELLRTPMWIVDLAELQRWWTNGAGLQFWNAASLEEWIARSPVRQSTPATQTRLHSMRRRLAQGETPTERWNLFPDGTDAVVVECRLSGIMIADRRGDAGRIGMLVEARPLPGGESDPHERRSYEALRHLSEPVSFYSESGEALLRNPAAIRAFGDPVSPSQVADQFAASFADPAQAAEARARASGDAVFRADVVARTMAEERWFDTEVRRTLDPVSGKPGLLVTQRDVAERRAHVEALERSNQRIAAQADALRVLAAPVIRVGAGVLALPLIGTLDHERVQVALAALLEHTAAGKVRRVVLDLTGASEVSGEAASGLLAIVRVLRLQGVASVLTGIRPALARAIVEAGLDISQVPCFPSVEDALA